MARKGKGGGGGIVGALRNVTDMTRIRRQTGKAKRANKRGDYVGALKHARKGLAIHTGMMNRRFGR